jgi:hypothetical protein
VVSSASVLYRSGVLKNKFSKVIDGAALGEVCGWAIENSDEGIGHYPLAPKEIKTVVELIIKNSK